MSLTRRDLLVRGGLGLAGAQRYLAGPQYDVQPPGGIYVAVWDGALKNYGPNLGYDYGGRLPRAWLDR